ncbi:carboxypeptidase B [Helicoverpa armigera]|uniref:carboxypeptidase B n=1 Tax=Helicoverpa armigera TaxID=29058 RepID=UPI00308358FB
MEIRYLFVFCAVVGAVQAGKHDQYSGHQVFGIKFRNASDSELLHRLEGLLDLDTWQHGVLEQRDAMVMVPPAKRDAFLKALDDEGVQHYVQMDDVAEALKKHDDEISAWKRARRTRMIFQDYWRYDQIDAYLERIASQYPDLVTLVNAGKSYEGRDIKYLKISTTKFNDPSKPIYFMDAMIHAREWVTTPVALYSIYRLVENLRSQDQDLLRDIDWIIMPLVNPDGYEFTHTDTRLWRKTRSVLPVHETCLGVDANRNFDVLFGTTGVSDNPCALTYPGTHAFSEPETGYVRDILHEHLNRIQLYMNIHSHGNWVLFGYGDHSLPPNAAQLHHVGAAMGAAMDAMKLPQAGYYLVGNSASLLYGTSGSAQDYAQVIGVPFSYTLELPGYGVGFLVPPQFIDHINEETWQGIAVTARLARSYYRARYNANN